MILDNFKNYTCDSLGNVFSKNKKLKQSKRNGYLCVTLCYNGINKTVNVHRIIADCFIPNPLNKPQVNHKDGNKQNNNVENLEWCTAKENTTHAIKNKLYLPPIKNRKYLSKPVKQLTTDGVLIANYESANEAKRITGFSQKWISSCANGGSNRFSGGIKKWVKCNSYRGYFWKWLDVKQEINNL